jgi:hypothetical protein
MTLQKKEKTKNLFTSFAFKACYRPKKISLKASSGTQEKLCARVDAISKKKLAGWKWLSR